MSSNHGNVWSQDQHLQQFLTDENDINSEFPDIGGWTGLNSSLDSTPSFGFDHDFTSTFDEPLSGNLNSGYQANVQATDDLCQFDFNTDIDPFAATTTSAAFDFNSTNAYVDPLDTVLNTTQQPHSSPFTSNFLPHPPSFGDVALASPEGVASAFSTANQLSSLPGGIDTLHQPNQLRVTDWPSSRATDFGTPEGASGR